MAVAHTCFFAPPSKLLCSPLFPPIPICPFHLKPGGGGRAAVVGRNCLRKSPGIAVAAEKKKFLKTRSWGRGASGVLSSSLSSCSEPLVLIWAIPWVFNLAPCHRPRQHYCGGPLSDIVHIYLLRPTIQTSSPLARRIPLGPCLARSIDRPRAFSYHLGINTRPPSSPRTWTSQRTIPSTG